MVYIIYRFSRIVNFLDTAISSYIGVLSTNPTAALYDIFIYLAIFLVIILSIVVIFLLHTKNKPIKLYIGTIIIYVIAFILIAYSYNIIGNMEIKIVDTKILRNVRDFLTIAGLIQFIEVILYGIRALGFDVKKFNVNIDINKAQRKVNKGKRFFKYFYVENKYLFFFISCISICILSLTIYLSLGVYNKKYTQTEFFTTNDFSLAISNSYITNFDYKGNQISKNKTFVILEITIKTNGRVKKQINLARPELVVGYNKYYHDNNYVDKFVDIGNVYNNEYLDNNFTKYLLVYPIDKDDINKKMSFRYIDSGSITSTEAKSIDVQINTRNLDQVKEPTKYYNLGDTINFKDSILGDTTFKINSEEIKNIFTLNYDFCIDDDCYPSIEYVKPSIMNNYDKTLLKINGEITWDEKVAKSKTTNLFNFINLYGSFSYKLDGKDKKDPTTLKIVKPIRVNEANNYYIELIKEVEKAEELSLILKIRDYIYVYKIV